MASDEPDHYLAVLKASYDYAPQSDDEVAIKEDQLLLLVEKVDEDWWKVKIKGSSQDTDSPVGLVPAAYVEQAEHTSIVKALYDYEAAAPGELSLAEDDILLVFETEEDWILVQNSKVGKAGYVPGNYVEVVDEEEQEQATPAPTVSRIVVPGSPPRPVSSYVDPADRVASSKVTADDIRTWSVSEIDKKGKKKKGTLGIGNGAVFFASEADKTPVQKWQTKDVQSVSSEKSKHVTIDIGGANSTTLHFHTGSKDTADSIVAKLNTSKAIAAGQPHAAEEEPLAAPSTAQEPITRESRNVHFSTTSVIIPSSQDVGDEEETPVDETYATPGSEQSADAVALYDFQADGEDELSVSEGEALTILEKDGDEWWKCRNSKGDVGVVPASYLEAVNDAGVDNAVHDNEEADREVQERQAQELAKRQEEEEEREKERERRRREQEEQQKAAAAARKLEAQQKSKQAAAAAEAERRKRQEAAAARLSPPPTAKSPTRQQDQDRPRSSGATHTTSRSSIEVSPVARPPADKTRVWHDRSGQFRVEAAFLGFNNGKLRLHKVNGVIVEVPSEKMSLDDMEYVERFLLDKSRRSTNPPRASTDDDNIPLAITHPKATPPAKKAPKIDWFDFFLSAGCDLDDCTRYASSFERDKIDETLLADITEGTMRSLGLREGDIIRVRKAIEKRRPTDNLEKPSVHVEEQMRRDKELAERLQAEETGNAPRAPPPNLFAGPGGVLKQRRGRPQTTKSLPLDNVDIKAIPTTPEPILRTTSPQSSSLQTPSLPARPSSAAARPSSTAPVVSGFDDDAWTNRPSSTKPVKAASPAPAVPVPPPTPPVQVQAPAPAPTAVPTPQQSTPVPAPVTSAPAASPAVTTTPTLSKSPDSDLFDQIARISALRQNATPQQPSNPSPAFNAVPPASYRAGLGMSTSPIPMGQLATQPTLSPLPTTLYNGPRGPFAPIPANQGLLQPLIPTQTGFNGFIPTKPMTLSSPFSNQLAPPNFLSQQPTGFPGTQPAMSQPTGMFNNFNPAPSLQGNNSSFAPIQSHVTGFNPPNNGTSNFGNMSGFSSQPQPPPLPTLNQSNNNNTSPANIFAQMKSGTFANEDNPVPSSSMGLNGQTPAWGQSYQGYTGY